MNLMLGKEERDCRYLVDYPNLMNVGKEYGSGLNEFGCCGKEKETKIFVVDYLNLMNVVYVMVMV